MLFETAVKNVLLAAPLLFSWGVFVTPLSIHISNRYRIVDVPGERKIHSVITPRGAGIVLWLGFLLWTLFGLYEVQGIRGMATGCTIVFLTGYWDDMKTLNPVFRFFAHIAAAGIFLVPLSLPPAHLVLFLLWITGMTNAYNLIDGANGLCLLMFITASLCASFFGNASLFFPAASMAAGVLYWNFPDAKTFLGDGGTTLLGYLYSSFLVLTLTPSLSDFTLPELPFLLLLAGGVPVLDTLFAIMRRLWREKSPFLPDRGHIHHRLLDLGLPAVYAVLTLTVFQALIVGFGIYLLNYHVS
ncbi:MAG: MraY family glycosyltransferase [Synergistaceae bacterium]|nr:MraY family glycosyltransferase [Synergistaceae bacterium]